MAVSENYPVHVTRFPLNFGCIIIFKLFFYLGIFIKRNRMGSGIDPIAIDLSSDEDGPEDQTLVIPLPLVHRAVAEPSKRYIHIIT